MTLVSSPWPRTLLAAAAAALPALAPAALIDVSQIVLGVVEPAVVHGGPITPCGQNCSYLQQSGANLESSYQIVAPPPPTTWPAFFGPSLPGGFGVASDSSVLQALQPGVHYPPFWPAPQPGAAVRWGGLPAVNQLSVETWKSGSGAAVSTYAIRITTPPDGPARRTYIDFEVPLLTRHEQRAYKFTPPPNPQTVTYDPRRFQSRAAVDVYVDGLPVWSSEDVRLLPQRYDLPFYAPLREQWDRPLDGSLTTLYLGTLPPRSTRTAVVVLRNDLRTDAPDCFTGFDAQQGDTLYSCDGRSEHLSLPDQWVTNGGIASPRPAIQVYTR